MSSGCLAGTRKEAEREKKRRGEALAVSTFAFAFRDFSWRSHVAPQGKETGRRGRRARRSPPPRRRLRESPWNYKQPKMTYQSTSETARVDLRSSSETEATDEKSTLGEDTELRLILVGKSGGGKSATGNTIFGRKEFESLVAAKTTTLRCQKGQGAWQGTRISVIDTPAIFDSEGNDEIVRREIMACVELSRPGPHALIFVTQVGRFTAEDKAAAKCVWDIFGAESARHTIVLFTCVEDLGRTPLKEYVQKSDNRNLRDLIRQCGNRVCGFNNKAKGAERESQVSELMKMVQRTVSANGGGYYTNRLYKMSNVQDEHVKAFLTNDKTGRERAVRRPWSSTRIVTLAALSCLLLAIVIAIILMICFL